MENLTVQILLFLNGQVLQAFPRGPYFSFGVCRSFVQVQFRTRYCGHTLSRLADFCHNMTKQSRLPTVRRRESENMTCVLHWYWGLQRLKHWEISFFNSSMPLLFFFEGLAGSFCTESTAQFCLEMCWFGMHCLLCCWFIKHACRILNEWRMWITCKYGQGCRN